MDKIPQVWVKQLPNGQWKWYVGPQCGDSGPTYQSTSSFSTKQYAQQNAEIRLNHIPHIWAEKKSIDEHER